MTFTPDSTTIQYKLHLFGSYQLFDRENSLLKFRSNSERALLAYLAVESERYHSREYLSSLIWPELDEQSARNNFRVTLSRLRNLIKTSDGASPVISSTNQSVRLIPNKIWVDVAEFSELIQESEDHAHLHGRECPGCTERFENASRIFTGEFLQGFSLPDNLPFLEWMVVQRERFHRQAINIFNQLARYHLNTGNLEKAHGYAQRQLKLEPWSEEAHRQLMKYFAITGQKNAALSQYESYKRILDQELSVSPSTETQELYERIKRARKRERPVLPPASSIFVGRQKEQGDILRMLARSDCKLLTIAGMGGVGKTRLATQIAKKLEYAFLDGVIFVPLANLKKTEQIPYAIADALGFSFGGKNDPFDQLVKFLESKELLIVLDNFEHLLEGTYYLKRILHTCPDIKMLVTSRERLGLRQECLMALGGLPVEVGPGFQNEESPAVDLLMVCIQKVEPAFIPKGQDKNRMVDLCRQVEGMPLAIELIAPMTRILSMDELIAEIGEIEQSRLEPVFERSWVLLSPKERESLMSLSYFNDPFNRDSAYQVANVDLSMVQSFVNKSLIQRVVPDENYETSTQSQAFFDFHPLLKQFINQKLKTDPKYSQLVQEDHASYFLDYLDVIYEYLYKPDESIGMQKVHSQYHDITNAIFWGCRHGRFNQVSKALQIYIHYYESFGLFREGKDFYGEIVQYLQMEEKRQNSSDRFLNRALAMAYWFHGWHHMRLGNYEEAMLNSKESVELASSNDDGDVLGGALNAIGVVFGLKEDFEKSNQYLIDALIASQRAEHSWHVASIHLNLGKNALYLSEFESAETHFEIALKIFKEIGHYWGIAGALLSFGMLHIKLENDDQAQNFLEEGLEIAENFHYLWMKIKLLVALGELAYKKGAWEEAIDYFEKSFDSIEAFGDKTLLEEAQEKYQQAVLNVRAQNSNH